MLNSEAFLTPFAGASCGDGGHKQGRTGPAAQQSNHYPGRAWKWHVWTALVKAITSDDGN